MKMIKVAIAHKDPMKAQRLRLEVSKKTSFQIIWMAHCAEEAIDFCRRERPDVILADVNITSNAALGFVATIMAETPCLIVLLASYRLHHEALIFDMMGQGAMDVVNTDFLELDLNLEHGLEQLLGKLAVVGTLLGMPHETKKPELPVKAVSPVEAKFPPLVLIGSSTGGPAALAHMMKQYPLQPNFTTIIVQHVDEQFTNSLARWLTLQTNHLVEVIKPGLKPVLGAIYLAGENKHLVMNSKRELTYSLQPENKFYKPSLDVFFHSVLEYWPKKAVAILLTGMGEDGAAGLKALHDHGWFTIAEHRQSCVVYGMPKAAIDLNAATEVIRLNHITSRILSYFKETYTT